MAKTTEKKVAKKKTCTGLSREERVTGKAPIEEAETVKETDNGSND